MHLTIQETQLVAALSNLTFTDDQLEVFAESLSGISAYVESLDEIDTDTTEMTAQVTGLYNIWREDVASESLQQAEALSGARETEKGFFKTSAVFES